MLLTKDKDDLQLIERFFERELTEQELADFEVRLKTDHDFAKQVERFGYAHQEVEKIYYPNERETFKKHWEKILDTDEGTPIRKVKSLRYYALRIAAAILLILGLTLIINQFSPSNDNFQQIAIQNWEQSEIPINMKPILPRGQRIDVALIRDKIEKAYNAKKYEEALNLLDLLGDESDALFWKGMCHFQLRQMPEAVSHFEQVIQHKDGGKKDLATWYQSLAYLYENDKDAAHKNLNIIIENDYLKARDAKKLLEEL